MLFQLSGIFQEFLEISRTFLVFHYWFNSSFFQVQKIQVFSSSDFRQKLENFLGNARTILERFQDSGNFWSGKFFKSWWFLGTPREPFLKHPRSWKFLEFSDLGKFQELDISGSGQSRFMIAFKILEVSRIFWPEEPFKSRILKPEMHWKTTSSVNAEHF